MALRRKIDKTEIRTYNNEQNMLLGFFAYHVMARRWFENLIEPVPDIVMSRLLMAVYIAFANKSVLSKKEASTQIGVKDIKTARKYLTQAENLEFIEVVHSKKDKRKELVFPTELLKHVVEKELHELASTLRYAMYSIASYPLPKTGEPNLIPGERNWGGPIAFEKQTHEEILREMLRKVSVPDALAAAYRIEVKRRSKGNG